MPLNAPVLLLELHQDRMVSHGHHQALHLPTRRFPVRPGHLSSAKLQPMNHHHGEVARATVAPSGDHTAALARASKHSERL